MHLTVEQVVEGANDNEPKLARFLPTEWSGGIYEETAMSQTSARIAIRLSLFSCNSDARDISLGPP